MRRVGLLLVGLWVSGCVSDPRDPNTWIKKLSDPRDQKDAIMQLRRIGDPVAVPPLVELYKKTKDAEVLKAIASFKDKRSVPTLVEALDFTEDSCEPSASAATALGDINDPSAVDALIKALQKPLPIKTRCNVVKLEAMKALVKMKAPAAVDALIKVLETPADDQDFFLNQEAARSLGEFADPKAVPALIRGLFMTGRGADIFQPCRIALMRIGQPAVQALVDAHTHKNEALEGDAKKYEFRPGVVEQKTALVLGDLRAKAAVPTLVATLKKPISGDNHRGALYALGMIADPSTTKEIVAILNDAKQDFKDRTSAAEALNFLGDPSAFPALLAAAKSADVTKDGQKYPDVRIAAAMAYARLGGAAEAAAFAPVAAAEKAAPEQFKECATRLELAKKCNKDVACYGEGLSDPSLPKQEKAAFMLGRLGKEAAPIIAKKISVHEPIVRLALLFSAGRVIERGSADAQAAIKAIDTQIDIDRTKPNMREVVNEMRALKAWLQSK
jgi:HEAT repeat protein